MNIYLYIVIFINNFDFIKPSHKMLKPYLTIFYLLSTFHVFWQPLLTGLEQTLEMEGRFLCWQAQQMVPN